MHKVLPQGPICHLREMEFHKLKLWITAFMALGFVTGLFLEWTIVSNIFGLFTNIIWLYGKDL